jgi:hypothetical protein
MMTSTNKEADMSDINILANGDLNILRYVHYMAQTAQADAAKQLFKSFLNQEKKRLRGNDGAGRNAVLSTVGPVQ